MNVRAKRAFTNGKYNKKFLMILLNTEYFKKKLNIGIGLREQKSLVTDS